MCHQYMELQILLQRFLLCVLQVNILPAYSLVTVRIIPPTPITIIIINDDNNIGSGVYDNYGQVVKDDYFNDFNDYTQDVNCYTK